MLKRKVIQMQTKCIQRGEGVTKGQKLRTYTYLRNVPKGNSAKNVQDPQITGYALSMDS